MPDRNPTTVVYNLPKHTAVNVPIFLPSITLFHALCSAAQLLKEWNNEKRGGSAVVSFDRSRFKLFSRKFSNKFVLAPSCERPKTSRRTLFL
jgi:hypothetical protein